MSAVFRAARWGRGGRKLQAVFIGLVVLSATAASTLALGMLADAHSPFDHAFASQNGADVSVTVETSVVSTAQITAAAKVKGVTAVAGPFAAENAAAHGVAVCSTVGPRSFFSTAQITAAAKVKGVTAVAGPFAAENVDAQVSMP